MIGKNTALQIALAYQEIERGEKLLVDVRQCIAERGKRWPDANTDIRDVFGQAQRGLQLGVPSGENGHRLFNLSYDLAVPIIEAHIANKRADLGALSALAKAELNNPMVTIEQGS